MPSATRRPPRVFSQAYLLEPLEGDDSLITKRMFGGLAVYYRGLLVLFLCEEPELKPAQRQWHGLLFPMARADHATVLERWPVLRPHSILAKWLYLPLDAPAYEETAPALIERIRKGDRRFGIEPRSRQKGAQKRPRKKPKNNC